MKVPVKKILCLLIATGRAILAIKAAAMYSLKCSAVRLSPLAFIWIPEAIAGLTGYFRSGYVNAQTPAIINYHIGSWLVFSRGVARPPVFRKQARPTLGQAAYIPG